MKFAASVALALIGIAGTAAQAQTITTLASSFNQPNAVAVDTHGNVFVADTANSAIDEITSTGGQVTVKTIGTGTGPLGAVALDAAGDIFAADSLGNRVVELIAATGYTVMNTLGSGFEYPTGVAVDGAGNVFVADQGNHAVKEILAADGYLTVNTLGSGFSEPNGVAVDDKGNVFVADSFVGVEEILAAGGYTTVNSLGSGFHFPLGVAVDSSGNVFVADGEATTAFEILAAGNYTIVETLVGGFNEPQGVALDAAGNLYLFDGHGNWRLPAASGYTTAAKLGSLSGGASGIAADASGDIFLVSFNASGIEKLWASDNYANPTHIATPGFSTPYGIAVDALGNLFVADTGNNAVKELTAASGFAAVTAIGAGFKAPRGVALDAQGNVFIADTGNDAIQEITASSGYASQTLLATRQQRPIALATDHSGNLFFANAAGLTELTAAGTLQPIVAQAALFSGIAVDGNGNLFLANNNPFAATGYEVRERLASDGYKTNFAVAGGFGSPDGLAIDSAGDIFVADSGGNAIREILATPPKLVASVLPDARSIEAGATATVFATMINTSPDALENCQIATPAPAFFTWPGVTLSYQTTDPTTNVPTGEPNTPVTIPGNNGQQSFVLSLQSDPAGPAFTAVNMPLQFTCGSGAILETAPIVPGVNSMSLSVSSTPIADVIALAATPTGNGIMTLPQGGAGAFAVASINVGAAENLTVTVDTGGTTLPLTAALCQTDPANGQCLSPPAASQSLSYAADAAPTFSVFLQSSGAIALSPATARVFIRFEDSGGYPHGVTSVAVDTQ